MKVHGAFGLVVLAKGYLQYQGIDLVALGYKLHYRSVTPVKGLITLLVTYLVP